LNLTEAAFNNFSEYYKDPYIGYRSVKMAEIISWLKVVGYVSVPIFVLFAISWGFKKHKNKNDRLENNQHSAKITNLKHSPFPSEREKTSDIVDDNYLGGLSGQMELERRRFAGEKL